MECKLDLSVFRFDAKTDILPYYKKHIITIDTSKTINELFLLIQEQDIRFSYPKDSLAAIKINGKALFTTASLEEIVENFGKCLTLEPLSTKRVIDDMIINDADFFKRFDLLDPFVEAKDKIAFQKYIPFHYASPVLDLLDEYQGDALFAFAYDMIQKYPERKESILKVISDEQTGIFNHVRLCNKIYPCAKEVEQKIGFLKNLILQEMPKANRLVEKLSHRIDSL